MLKRFMLRAALVTAFAGGANADTAGAFTPGKMDSHLRSYGGTLACHSVGLASIFYAKSARKMGISDPDKAGAPSDVLLMGLRPWSDDLPQDFGVVLSSVRYLIHNDALKRDIMVAIKGIEKDTDAEAAAYSAASVPCVTNSPDLSQAEVRKGVVSAFERHYMDK